MADKLLGNSDPPLKDAVVDNTRTLTNAWRDWFRRLPATLDSIPSRLNDVSLSNQSTSISATNFAGYSLLPGRYRVTYGARITTPDSVSSSLTVTLSWTTGGVGQSYSGAAMTGNTTTTFQSGTLLIRVDGGTAVNYATTFTSGGIGSPEYSLDVTLEKLKT